jgi:hypothetical protein
MAATISKAEMLSKIVESGEMPFRIKYVKATGKNAGQIDFRSAYFGAPNPYPKGQAVATAPARKSRKSYLESNSIPLTEFGTSRMLTPFISHIIEFNGRQVIH